MKFQEAIQTILLRLQEAYNAEDFTVFRSYLADKCVLQSDNVSYVYPNLTENQIIGKNKIIDYWIALLQQKPNKIDISEVKIAGRKAVGHCLVRDVNVKVELTIELDQYGKVILITAQANN